jgi:pyrroline-5-carboxylate reductase
MNEKMTFIGGGNMAEALIQGILASGLAAAESVWVTDIREERLTGLQEKLGVCTTTDNAEAVRGAETVWLCVKPQQMVEVLQSLQGAAPNALYVSIAAGVTTSTLEKALGGGVRVVRVMPNTPALVQAGAAGISAGSLATDEDVQQVETLMGSVGKTVVVPESDLHAVTALSGSGPAYVFYLVESMLKAAESFELDPEKARELVVQTIIGSGKLLQESGLPAAELRARVTSKGGTTFAATETFTAHGVDQGVIAGVFAAAERSRELAGE